MNTINSIKSTYRKFHYWYRIAWKPKSLFHVPFNKKIIYALRGFNSNEYVWYDLKQNNYRDYISEYERVSSRGINGEYKFLLDDKLIFSEIVGKYVKVPEIIAWIKNGDVYGIHGTEISNETLLEKIMSYKDVVVKWEKGYEGKGTFIIHYDGEVFTVNNVTHKPKEVEKIIFSYSNSILCEYMHQCDFENKLFADSVNTLRIICAKKNGEKKAKILYAVQRIGTKTSAPVDNVSAGALAALIDIETGTLESAIQAKSHDKNKLFLRYQSHPDNGSRIEGERIPNWEEIKKTIVELTNKLPYFNFVAWDVLLTTDGICVIEGNSSAGLMMLQVHGGVRNSVMGEIYRSYGIIK